MNAWTILLAALASLLSAGCYSFRPSSGAGQTSFTGQRTVDAGDVAVPNGYMVEMVARDLTFPTGITFDDNGTPIVVEAGYSYGEVFTVPRLIALEPGGPRELARGPEGGPWTGVTYHDGALFVAAGDVRRGGKVLRITGDGTTEVLVDELPSHGDHHTNGPVIGPDGWLYFTQGTATNSGFVGVDNAKFGWLQRFPDFHDVPAHDLVLRGVNHKSPNPLTSDPDDRVVTGAFLPFGTRSQAGQVVKGRLKSSGSVLRVRPSGGDVELVAWGFRNPFGLAFSPTGTLFVTENGYDDRGSRPVWGSPDFLWEVEPGAWYGWPDFVGGVPITHFRPPDGPPLEFVLAEHPQDPPEPRARFAVHASANGFDFSRNERFGHEGEAFVALFGDQAPDVGKVLGPVGCRVVRVNTETGVIEGFAVNRGPKSGPASKIGGGGLERPIAARFSPDGTALYIVDFGVLLMSEQGAAPVRGTGVVWRIARERN